MSEAAMKYWRKTFPFVVSTGLIVWLASRISLDELLRASAVLPWQRLAPMTAGLVILLYFWDAFCLLTVYSLAGKQLTYGRMLRRGKSYLVGALNQGLGQAAVAWQVARVQSTSFAAALSRSFLLAWHEGVILATAALAGAWWSDNPHAMHARGFCAVLLAVLLGAGLLTALLPAGWRRGLQRRRWGAWLSQWNWRLSLRLILLRMIYFAIVGTYVVSALWICGQGIAPATALAVIPLVLMATILPSAQVSAPAKLPSICCSPRNGPTSWWRWA